MQIFSTLKWIGLALLLPFVVFAQPCTDYSEATLTGDTVCTGSPRAIVRVHNTILGKPYQAFLGNKALGSPITSTGTGTIVTFFVPVSELSVGANIIGLRSTDAVCGSMPGGVATVLVNPLPSVSMAVIGDTICASADSATVTILAAQVGVEYRASINGMTIITSTKVNGTTLTLRIPASVLPVGQNLVRIQATIISCAIVDLTNTAMILVHPVPAFPFELKEDTLMASAEDKFVPLIFNWRAQGIGCKLEHIGTNNKALLVPMLSSDTLGIPMPFLSPDTNRIKISTGPLGCGTQPYEDTLVVIVKPAIVNSLERNGASLLSHIGPNPFSSTLHIGLAKSGHYHLRVLNAVGALIHEQALNSYETTLSTPWPSGAYYLEIEGEGSNERRKLIK